MNTKPDTSNVVQKPARKPSGLPARPPAQPPAQAVALRDPMQALLHAIQTGVSPEILGQLMDLQQRWERNEARKAFERALTAFRLEIKPIVKSQRVGFEAKQAGGRRTDYQYEDLAQIAEEVDPILAKHGLNYRFRSVRSGPTEMTMTCIISHADGHSEESSLPGPYDPSGNKNALQAIGSAATYLQRYSLKIALGLAAARDDDGQGGGKPVERVSEAQVEQLKKAVLAARMDPLRLFEWASERQKENVEGFEGLLASLYEEALTRIWQFKAAKDAKLAAAAKAQQEQLDKAVQQEHPEQQL